MVSVFWISKWSCFAYAAIESLTFHSSCHSDSAAKSVPAPTPTKPTPAPPAVDERVSSKKSKSKKRRNKNDDSDVEEENVGQTICAVCKNDFATKNKLFAHLKSSGHAVPLAKKWFLLIKSSNTIAKVSLGTSVLRKNSRLFLLNEYNWLDRVINPILY